MSDVFDLCRIGWHENRESYLQQNHPGLSPARVVIEHKGSYKLLTGDGERTGEATGRLLHDAIVRADLPAVGDWLAIRLVAGERKAMIEAVLPRTSSFSRDIAGLTTEEQVLAANIDVVFVVAGLDGELNVRRVERFLTLAWESGAVPVVILTKSDLCDDVAAAIAVTEGVAPGVPVVPVSARAGTHLADVRTHIEPGQTIVVLGASGVGKSTLINRLLSHDVMPTDNVRWNGKGRHTTTHRQLIPLPESGCVIDTPGLRELRLWSADHGIDTSFADITEIASACRFTDCSHDHEPDCAVMAAVADGELDRARLASFNKLQRELAALARKNNVHLARAHSRRFKHASKAAQMRSRERW